MSNHNDEERLPNIVEDGPTMRSVSMMSPMAPAMPLRSTAALPQKTFLRQDNALEPLPDGKHAHVVDRSPWVVSKGLAIPSYYQFERTHVGVPKGSSIVVSERIADFFFKESIAATFDDKQVC